MLYVIYIATLYFNYLLPTLFFIQFHYSLSNQFFYNQMSEVYQKLIKCVIRTLTLFY